MRKIFRTNLQLGIFIATLVITLATAFLGFSNAEIDKKWVNQEYESYIKDPGFYTVTSVPIKAFKTLNGTDDESLRVVDFYRVCLVDVKVAGGQNMHFYVSRDRDDKIGDNIEIAYPKHWDTDYEKIMKASEVDSDSELRTARTNEVSDGLYSQVFSIIAVVSAVFTAAVFFICYKKKDAYEL